MERPLIVSCKRFKWEKPKAFIYGFRFFPFAYHFVLDRVWLFISLHALICPKNDYTITKIAFAFP